MRVYQSDKAINDDNNITITIPLSLPKRTLTKELKKIINKHMEKFDMVDTGFSENLVAWADIIRKTFYDDGVDEVISTRRLCHIVQTFSIFKDKMKSIDLCIARFDDDTKLAFLDLYSKVDSGVNFNDDEPPLSAYDDFAKEEEQFTNNGS